MDFQRIFLSLIFVFSVFLLWDSWQRYQHPERFQPAAQPAVSAVSAASAPAASGASAAVPAASTAPGGQVPVGQQAAVGGKKILVKTDFFSAEINTKGGNLQHLDLLKHRAPDSDKPFALLEKQENHVYFAQSGLLGDGLGLPDHYAEFSADAGQYELAEGKDSLEVRLHAVAAKSARVTKIYTFHRGSYQIDVSYEIENTGAAAITPEAYFQLVRDDSNPAGDSKFVPTYVGPAFYTEAAKYQKVSFSDIEKKKATFADSANNGWVAMVQHYFVSAWLPQSGVAHRNYVNELDNRNFSAGLRYTLPAIEPGKSGSTRTTLYAGPAVSRLDEIAPGLGLTVDYGILTPISKPLFIAMAWIEGWVKNWGVAIIILTLGIKLLFFPLSAASYRSMAKMRVVAPKLARIKEQYADDRERLHKAMMELYKTEKINPMGGCLPMLIQIPVFISLYWAILASVELRHAPFFGWIGDLSSPDPYYILPAIMAASMLVQTKLNPTPPDPLQAKIMQTMPFIFGVVFFFFPAGLVLYSVVNNILSILQQWYITRGTEKTPA